MAESLAGTFAGLVTDGPLLVAAAVAVVIGVVLLNMGKKAMSAASLKPDRTVENVKADVNLIKDRH